MLELLEGKEIFRDLPPEARQPFTMLKAELARG